MLFYSSLMGFIERSNFGKVIQLWRNHRLMLLEHPSKRRNCCVDFTLYHYTPPLRLDLCDWNWNETLNMYDSVANSSSPIAIGNLNELIYFYGLLDTNSIVQIITYSLLTSEVQVFNCDKIIKQFHIKTKHLTSDFYIINPTSSYLSVIDEIIE